MIKCSNCHRRVDFMRDYEVSCVDVYGTDDTFYLCDRCVKDLPERNDGFGCDLCGEDYPLHGQILIRNIKTGNVQELYVLCDSCYMDLYGSIYEICLKDFIGGEYDIESI